MRIDDTDARAHSDLGTALLGTQDFERALSELERAVQLDPQRASFHSNLGFAERQAGHVDRAVAEYREEALRLDVAVHQCAGLTGAGWLAEKRENLAARHAPR